MKTYIFPIKSHSLKAPLRGVGGLIIALLMLGVFTSCITYEPPPLTEPRYTGEANVTIAELRARFGHVTEPTPIGINFILRVRVAANDVSGNLFNQLYVQDETGGIIINVARSSLFNDFRIGQEVYIHLRELFITTFGGQIQIGFAGSPPRVPWEIFNHVAHRNGWPQADRITPRLVTLDELNNLDALGQSEIMATLVRLDYVFFEGGGEDAFVEDNRTTNRTLVDFYGNSILVRTSSFASFSADILPTGAGTVYGMLTKHNNDWQIILRSIDDLQLPFEQSVPETTVIFHERFGSPAGNTLIANYEDWETSGIGAGSVRFVGTTAPATVDVRASSPFPGTTSSGNVMFNAFNGGTFYIKQIATCGAQNLRLSFATNQTDEVLSVAYRVNGTNEWIDVPFTKTTATWGRVNNLDIVLPEGANTFNLRFVAGSTQFGTRLDDVRITTTDKTGEPIVDYTLLFEETFGIPAANTLIADYEGWETSGIGAGSVRFVGTTAPATVDVRSSGASSGYEGASGGGNVMFNAAGGGVLYINQIATCGAQNLVLSFGTNQTDNVISVAYRISGTYEWIDIPFTKTTTTWGLVENLNIALPVGTNTINLRFTAGTTQFGARIDDIRITTTYETGEAIIDPDIPPPPVLTLIFLETFGSPVQVGTLWPTIAEFTALRGFVTTGIGAGAVYFEGTTGTQRVDVRGNFVSNFPGASGGGNVLFNANNGGVLYINDIATCGAQNLMLSFGTNQTDDIISVAYRINGTDEWISIPFEKNTNTWGLVRDLPITLPEGTNTIRLRFTVEGVQHGVRIDDVRITTFDETGEPYIDPDNGNGNNGAEPEPTLIFLETFGNPVQVGNAWPTITDFTGFNTSGIGAGAVYFTSTGGRVDVRGNHPSPSGGGNVMFSATNGGALYINDIATCGAQNLVLSFGTNVGSESLSVYLRINGTDYWFSFPPFSNEVEAWTLFTYIFTLPAGANTIRLRFVAQPTQFGARIDDVRITTTDATGEAIIDPDNGN